MKGTPKLTAATVCVLLIAASVAPAQYAKTPFMEERSDFSNEMNIRTVLGVKDTRATTSIRSFLLVLDICEALEKFSHGEYNDGAAVLAKAGATTLSAIGAIIAAAIDVGTVCRDAVVKAVFEPQVQTFYEEYRIARLADLERQLDQKKLGFNGGDFASWASDADGGVADKTGSSDVRFFVDDKVIGPSANRGLYNIAQMKIQDQRHSTRPWYIKLIGRIAPSGKPVSPTQARDYWLQEWNKKVVIEGMEYIVDKKKQYIETFTKSSTINVVVEVTRPVEGLHYALRCRELGWEATQQPVEGIAGLQVIFLETVDVETFMEVTRSPRRTGAVRFELLVPDGKVVQVRDIPFADMMSTAGGSKFEDKTGIWHEYRAKVDFDWAPPAVGRVGITLPSGARLERLNIGIGSARVNLSTTGTETGMPGETRSGLFSLQQWITGTSFDTLALLEKMHFDPASYRLPDELRAYPSVSVSGSYKIPERRDDEVVERSVDISVRIDLPKEDYSLAIPFYARPEYEKKTAEELRGIYERIAARFISNPGTYPGDLLRLRAELPTDVSHTAWQEHITEPANDKLEGGLQGSFEALNTEIDELRERYSTRSPEGDFRNGKERILGDLRETLIYLCNSPPAPFQRDEITSKLDELVAEVEAVRQQVRSDTALSQKLLSAVQRDIVPELTTQRNLIEVSSHSALPGHVSQAIADLEAVLSDQQRTLYELARVETEPRMWLASFDVRLAALEQRAAAGAFYGKRFEQLQAEAEALDERGDVLTAAAIRQTKSLDLLTDVLRWFDFWASEGFHDSVPSARAAHLPRQRRPAAFPLDALYEHVMGAEPTAIGGQWPDVDAMVEELMIEFHRLTSEEVALFEGYEAYHRHTDRIMGDAFSSGGRDNLSPMSALYASHLSLADLEPARGAKGGLNPTALGPAKKRAAQVQESWRASTNERSTEFHLEGRSLTNALGLYIGEFIEVCDRPDTAGDNAAIREWHDARRRIEAGMEQLATVGLPGLSDVVAGGGADMDKLGQLRHSPELAKGPWRERYEILREESGATRTIGDRYLDAMSEAIVRLLGVADARFHARLSRAVTLSGTARDQELEELNQMTSQDYWAAVGLKLPTETLYGESLVILAGARHSGPLEAAESKWSDVVSGWIMALEQAQ